jgi:hypothetical protein
MRTELVGASELRGALKKFSPDLDKEVRDEIISFLKPVIKKARGYMPSNDAMPSGFVGASEPDRFPKYEAKVARRGIGYKLTSTKPNSRGWSSTVSIHNKTRAGAIYETAGSKSVIVGKFTPNLPGTLTTSGSMKGRAMYRAYAEDEGKAKAGVIQALEKAAAKFNARGNNG